MDTSIYLARVFGIILFVSGLIFLFRRHYFMDVVEDFSRRPLLWMICGLMEFVAGVFLVMAHHEWTSLHAGLITALGYLLIIEGVVYLIIGEEGIKAIISFCNVPAWYITGGIICAGLGGYLTAVGFGFI